MAGVNKSYALNFIADISEYQRKLKELPGYTDKTAAVAAERLVRRMTDAQEKAATAARKAAGRASDAWDDAGQEQMAALGSRLDDVSERSGRAEQAIIGFRDVLEGVAPGVSDALRPLGDFAGGIEAIVKGAGPLALGLGSVAAAVAAMGAAYYVANQRVEAAEEAQRKAAETAETAASAYKKWKDAISGVETELAILLGELPEVEAKVTKARAGAAAQLEDQIGLQKGRINAIQLERDELRRDIADRQAAGRTYGEQTQRLNEVSRALEVEHGKLGAMKARLLEVQSATEQVVRETEAQADVERGRAAATAASEEALKAQAQRQREAAEWSAKLTAEIEAQAEAFATAETASRRASEGLAAIVRGLNADGSPMGKLVAETKALMGQVDELTQQRLEQARKYGADTAQIEAEDLEARLAIYASFEERRLEIVQAAIDEERRLRQEAVADGLSTARSAVDSLVDWELSRRTSTAEEIRRQLEDSSKQITGAERAELEKRLAAEQQAATRAFRAQQLLGLADVAISTAQGVQKSLAQYGLPWGLIPAAAVTASGAVQAGLILSQEPPRFHSGLERDPGEQARRAVGGRRQADEVPAVLTRDERVLTPRGVNALGGDDAVAAANRGEGSSRPMVLRLEVGGRVLDTVAYDLMRGPSRMRRETRGRRIGHWSAR